MSFPEKPLAIPIPDLRFENSFLKTLQGYADKAQVQKSTLTDAELRLLDLLLAREHDLPDAPIAPVTPAIVIYAVIKDIVLRPLVEGFVWAGILILFKPTMRLVLAHGMRTGTYLASLVGLNNGYMKR